MQTPLVSIIADSISLQGVRLTTFQLRYWRPIHSELMTHRVFSRNAGSSRARPSKAIIEQVRNDPWGPTHWGADQPGMQAHTELVGDALKEAQYHWKLAAYNASLSAEEMLRHGTHKQIVNRLLEPFTYIDVVLTATDFTNWFDLRDHPDAQPEIQQLARLMGEALDASDPVTLVPGDWHLPYINGDADSVAAYNYCKKGRLTRDEPNHEEILAILRKVSVARCARVSYKAFDGNPSPIEKDLDLYDKLLGSDPIHASPAEHQATPDTSSWYQTLAVGNPDDPDDDDENVLDTSLRWDHPKLHGNFDGWIQYRRTLPSGIADAKSRHFL